MIKYYKKLLMVSGIAALSLPLSAESVIKVTQMDESAVSVPLNTGTKISFSQTGVDMANEGADIISFPYADIKAISFGHTSGVTGISMQRTFGLRQNPVENALEVVGHDGSPSDLFISSMAGVRMKSVKKWNGEAIDVSSLPSGVYILSINNKSIKFIKK